MNDDGRRGIQRDGCRYVGDAVIGGDCVVWRTLSSCHLAEVAMHGT